MSKSSAVEERRKIIYDFLDEQQAYLSIAEISEVLQLKYSLVSSDLKVLLKQGLVLKKKDSSTPPKLLYMATVDEIQEEALTSQFFTELRDSNPAAMKQLERTNPEAMIQHLPQLLECLYQGESELQIDLLKLLNTLELPPYGQYFIDMFLNTHPSIEESAEHVDLPHFKDGMKAYIYETLRNWRFGLSRPLNRPVYMILQNHALREIAEHQPRSLEALESLKFIGQKTVENYGKEIISIVQKCLNRDVIGLNNYNRLQDQFDMRFVLIPPGYFIMGSPDSELHRQEREYYHQVTIEQPFYIQTTPVTQLQWFKIMHSSPSYFQGSDHPVENIDHQDIKAFIDRLNSLSEFHHYRLPCEDEWEYALRADHQSAYFFGDTCEALDEYAWYCLNSAEKTHPVRHKKPNGWGLYDMLGNVWEVVNADLTNKSEHYDFCQGDWHLKRGGSWHSFPQVCRSAYRYYSDSKQGNKLKGFRLVMLPYIVEDPPISHTYKETISFFKKIPSNPEKIIALGNFHSDTTARDDWNKKLHWLQNGYGPSIFFFLDQLKSALNDGFALAVVPSLDNTLDGIKRIARRLIYENHNLIDLTESLQRIQPLEASKTYHPRTIQEHLESIQVTEPEKVKHCHVLLLDDVAMTGHSIEACKQLLLKAGAKSVQCLVLGR